jgi:glyoxylase-like metal-dependent hydrolase (beta-lactamase superfamily II)
LHEWSLVLGHSSEAEGLAELDPDTTLAGADYDITDIRTLKTGDASLEGSMITALPYDSFTAKDYRLKAPSVQAIDEGYLIDLGTRKFEVLHLPGHCPGQLGFWDATNKVLIGCDAIYDDEPLDTLHHSDRAANRKSLQRLLALDVKVVHGGHGKAMTPARMREVIETYLAETSIDH